MSTALDFCLVGFRVAAPMSLPLTKALKLYNEHVKALDDPTVEIPEITLHRIIHEARRGLKDAGLDDRWAFWSLIGLAERRLAHLPEAASAFRNALLTRPNDPYSAASLGTVLAMLGRHREALPFLATALRNVPAGSITEVLVLCAQAEALHTIGEAEGARAALTRAIRLARAEEPQMYLRLADVLASSGRDDDAVEFLARAVAAGNKIERGDRPALELLRDVPAPWLKPPLITPVAAEAWVRVAEREDAPLPEGMATPARVSLSPEGWARFAALVKD